MSLTLHYLYALGVMCLLHGGYSAAEFYQYVKTTGSTLSLPLDIFLEVLFGAIASIAGAVVSITIAPQVSVHDDSVRVRPNRFFKPIEMRAATAEFQKLGVTPFEEILTKPAFIDFTAKRKEYQEWIHKE